MTAELKELIEITTQGFNLPITILLIMMLIYWLSVIFGLLDIDLFQFDLDVQVDADGTIDMNANGDMDVEAGGSFASVLLYFNIGTVPVTVWLSFLIFTCWILTILETYYFNPGRLFIIGAAFAIPNLIAGMYVAKFACIPLKKVFSAMDSKAVTNRSLIGKRAIVSSSKIDKTFGQIQLKTDGAPITLNARTISETDIPKGAIVVLTKEIEPGTFIVETM
jgi:hypothetical protein